MNGEYIERWLGGSDETVVQLGAFAAAAAAQAVLAAGLIDEDAAHRLRCSGEEMAAGIKGRRASSKRASSKRASSVSWGRLLCILPQLTLEARRAFHKSQVRLMYQRRRFERLARLFLSQP